MRLIVVSPATKKYAKEFIYDELHIVEEPPKKYILKLEDLYKDVLAIGGGSVIDTAKILCNGRIVAIPTTYSGASGTSHAVYWDGNEKRNIKCKEPITIVDDKYSKDLPKEVEAASKVDCMCHIIESLLSPKANDESDEQVKKAVEFIRKGDWLSGSIHAGSAIEITGTNLVHGLSYGLTTKYNLPHGVALSHILNLSKKYKKVEELL